MRSATTGTSAWPPTSLSLKWVEMAIANTGLRDAFLTSIVVALGATLIALVLGSLAALAVARHRFFGRETVSFVVIFPIALPGIVTGMALARPSRRLGSRSGCWRSSWATPRSASSSSTTT